VIADTLGRLSDYMVGVASRGQTLNREQMCLIANELLALSHEADALETCVLSDVVTGLAVILKETDHGRR
jgi:hypothetical protein